MQLSLLDCLILFSDSTNQHPSTPPPVGASSRLTAGRLLTEAGGLGGVPLAQFGAVGHVAALQEEAGVAAVVQRGALHRGPGGLGRHPPVLQGRPHPWTQQHCKPARPQLHTKRDASSLATTM